MEKLEVDKFRSTGQTRLLRATQPGCSACAEWCFRAQGLKAAFLYGKEQFCQHPRTVLSPPQSRTQVGGAGRAQGWLCCVPLVPKAVQSLGGVDATFPPLLCIALLRMWGTKAGAGGMWMLLQEGRLPLVQQLLMPRGDTHLFVSEQVRQCLVN